MREISFRLSQILLFLKEYRSLKPDATFPQKVLFRLSQMLLPPKTLNSARAETRTTLKTCLPPGPNARRDEIARSGEPLTPTYGVCTGYGIRSSEYLERERERVRERVTFA